MDDVFVLMKVNEALNDLCHDFFTAILINFADELIQISIWTIFHDNSQGFFLVIKKEFSGRYDILVLKIYRNLSLFSDLLLVPCTNFDGFDRILGLVY